jgi:hypothetical protein
VTHNGVRHDEPHERKLLSDRALDRDMREQEAGLYTRLARRTPRGGAA